MLKRGSLIRGLLALSAGAAAALLVACGSTGSSTGLIPTSYAGPLKADFELVARAATSAEGDCTKTEAALAKTERDFDHLPTSINTKLHERLAEGIENLRSVAIERCSQPPTGTTGETSTLPKTTTTPTETPHTETQEEETGGAPTPVEPEKREEEANGGAGGGATPEQNPGGGSGGGAGGAAAP